MRRRHATTFFRELKQNKPVSYNSEFKDTPSGQDRVFMEQRKSGVGESAQLELSSLQAASGASRYVGM